MSALQVFLLIFFRYVGAEEISKCMTTACITDNVHITSQPPLLYSNIKDYIIGATRCEKLKQQDHSQDCAKILDHFINFVQSPHSSCTTATFKQLYQFCSPLARTVPTPTLFSKSLELELQSNHRFLFSNALQMYHTGSESGLMLNFKFADQYVRLTMDFSVFIVAASKCASFSKCDGIDLIDALLKTTRLLLAPKEEHGKPLNPLSATWLLEPTLVQGDVQHARFTSSFSVESVRQFLNPLISSSTEPMICSKVLGVLSMATQLFPIAWRNQIRDFMAFCFRRLKKLIDSVKAPTVYEAHQRIYQFHPVPYQQAHSKVDLMYNQAQWVYGIIQLHSYDTWFKETMQKLSKWKLIETRQGDDMEIELEV
eukprot:1036462_1